VRTRTVEKIKTVFHFLDRDGVLLGIMLENELLKVEESPFMGDFLSNLYKGLPSVFGSESCAIGTLPMLNKVFDLEGLL
jgi:hypothetical protein